MACKDNYDKAIKEIAEDAAKIRSLNREQSIERLKNIITGKARGIGIVPIEGNFSNLTDRDINRILTHIRSKDWQRRESSVLCNCVKEEGLNLKNVDKIIGIKNMQFARNGLMTYFIKSI